MAACFCNVFEEELCIDALSEELPLVIRERHDHCIDRVRLDRFGQVFDRQHPD